MASDDQYKLINQKLVKILHDLLATGNWEASLFLRTAHKKLQHLQDTAIALSKKLDASGEDTNPQRQIASMICIYVSLYQADPYNLKKWENTLRTIREHSINRPLYRDEEHVQAMLRVKASPNEGYVAIYIQPTDIIPPYAGKLIEDRLGHELLTLRDNSLTPDNIIEFVHLGKRYHFTNGNLVPK